MKRGEVERMFEKKRQASGAAVLRARKTLPRSQPKQGKEQFPRRGEKRGKKKRGNISTRKKRGKTDSPSARRSARGRGAAPKRGEEKKRSDRGGAKGKETLREGGKSRGSRLDTSKKSSAMEGKVAGLCGEGEGEKQTTERMLNDGVDGNKIQSPTER